MNADSVQASRRTAGLPFGPGDFMWDWFGSIVLLPVAASGALLQVMHPVISAGVDQHSNYTTEPFKRGIDTLNYFNSWVYDPQEARRARETLRKLHENVSGIDHQGNKYHALNRDPYAFIWYSTIPATVIMLRLKKRHATEAELDVLYDEIKNLGRIWGVAEALMPATYAEAAAEFDRLCSEVLEKTPAAVKYVEVFGRLPVPLNWPKWLAPIWPVFAVLLRRPFAYVNRAYLPAIARQKMGMQWTATDAAILSVIEGLLRCIAKAAPICVSQPSVLPLRWRAYRTGLKSEYASSKH